MAHLWHTNEFRAQRPTPVDEAKWALAVVEKSLWQAVPDFLRQLSSALESATGESLPLDARPVKLVSWIGGDRDGNPNVMTRVTRETILLNRWKAADLYLRDINELIDELSMSSCDDNLAQLTNHAPEPYRFVLRDLRVRLTNTLKTLDAQLTGAASDRLQILASTERLWHPPLHVCWISPGTAAIFRIGRW